MKISKKQLLKIIREEAETVGVEKVKFSTDNFGGGSVEKEPFVDAEADELNQNKNPGKVKDLEVIPEISRKQLRRMIQEQAGGGLPSVDDLAKKLGSAGPEAAIDFIQRLLTKANFSAPEIEEPEAPAVEPELPPVPPEEV